jgi:adenylate cyclase, class 2
VQNVEIKVELRDPALARQILITPSVGATWIMQLRQTDTYYKVPAGRLKKRESPGEPTEYIFYDRSDKPTARLSHFKIYSEAQAAERFGSTPLPVWAVVTKTRDLYMLGNVRIHLDEVEGLGAFLELEALVSPQHGVAACHEVVADLRAKLAPVLGETIACGYSDLIAIDHA